MNKLLYILKTVSLSLWRKKVEKIGIIISFAFSLLFPILILFFSNFIYDQIATSNFKNEEFISGISFTNKRIEEDQIKKIVSSSRIVKAMFHNSGALINVKMEDKLIQHPSTFIEPGTEQIIHTRILEGRYFTPEELHNHSLVCILTLESVMELDIKKEIGDTLNIDGYEFTIIGLTDTQLMNNYILIPYRTYKSRINRIPESEQTFFLILSEAYNESLNDTLWEYFSDVLELEPTDIWSYINFNEQGKERAKIIVSILFILSLFIYVYSILNLSSILMMEFQKVKKIIGIKLAIGCERKYILIEYAVEYFILSFISVLIVHLIIPLALFIIKQNIGFNILFDNKITFLSFIFPLITSLIISLSIQGKVFNLNIKEVLKG